MARRPEGWKISREPDEPGGWHYLRFRYQGTRRKLGLGTQDAGEAAQRAPVEYSRFVEGKRSTGRLSATTETPLDELAVLWLDSLRGPGGLDARTIDTYLGYVRRWGKRWTRLGELTRRAIEEHLKARLGETTRATVRKEKSALSGFLAWARDLELLDEVPAPHLPRRAPGTRARSRREPVPLSHDEVQALLAQIPERARKSARGQHAGHRFPLRAYAEFHYETGLRPATIARLSVGTSWAPGRQDLTIEDDEDKATWGRTVPLSERALELLARHAPAKGLLWGRYPLIAHIRAAARAAGLDESRAARVAPYDLRHARITALTDAGATRSAVQLLAGHRHASTTDKYLHPLQSEARAALGLLGGAFCAPGDGRCKAWRIGSAIGSAASGGGLSCLLPTPEVCQSF